ncbi:MAG TPA: DUF2061 domain-containing protein [Reyranella sp.]|nr:DUF2061 domain-containing protein [Reyranella sp.]
MVINPTLTNAVIAVGAVAAGAAILEAALLPGLAIGVAAFVAPRLMPRRPRKAKPRPPEAEPTPEAKPHRPRRFLPESLEELTHIRFSQSVMKTITFRVIVTSLDFTANYLILQNAAVAAGLSGISIVGGPLFYFIHESGWNYLVGSGKVAATHPALVKTITYRTFATLVEFTTNYVVVGDVATAALLSSFGFFLGPFVYYGHELAWERYGTREQANRKRPPAVIIDVEPEPA